MTAALTTSSPTTASAGLHRALWGVQVVLAFVFLVAGGMKLVLPIETLLARMPWIEIATDPLVRGIGAVEVLGALGVILPSALRIAPRLSAVAAAGLVLVMVGAAGLHGMREEFGQVPINVVLGLLAAFVAWGRWRRARIAAK